jgi:autotransporter-associated beta strand protein
MNISTVRLIFCALLPLSLFAQDATWIATSSSDLENTANWNPTGVPTGIATFDSTVSSVNLFPQITASGPSSLSFSNFTFPNAANFMFTINGPYSLGFVGTGSGITGTNTNTIITATNATTGMSVPQLTFSGTNTAIGDAKLYAVVQTGATLVNAASTTDLAQIVFDGSGNSPSQSCTITIDSDIASMQVNNYGNITTATSAVNNIGQVLFDGSGGSSSGAAGIGSSQVTILGDFILAVDTALGQTIGNGFQANNTTQILFDGSGGFSSAFGGTGQSIVTIGGEAQILATLTQSNLQSEGIGNDVAQIAFDGSGGTSFGAGGIGSSTVVLMGNAVISATAPDYGYPGYYSSGTLNDTAQILFSGSGGLSYGAAGQGSSTVTITDSVTLYAENTYYMTLGNSIGNDVAQILFDGSGGFGYHGGGRGSLTATINGQAQITAVNASNSNADGYIYTQTAYANDLAQILFDGTPGVNYLGMGSGFCSVSIGQNAQISATNQFFITNAGPYINDVGQIVFDGGAGFGNGAPTGSGVVVIIEDNVIMTANNASTATIQGGYGNNCGQIIFDGGGGFSYDHGGPGSAQVTLQGAVQISATNAGNVVSNGSYSNDVAQILFDGSGGSSNDTGSSGRCIVSITDSVSLQATNSGTLGNASTNMFSNNIAQILLDGSGGLNAFQPGTGYLAATISTPNPITAVNQFGGVITSISGSSSNKIGQIIFDGGKGSNNLASSGNLTVTFSNSASLSASNSGRILNSGSAQGVGQIIFDGTAGSGSGSCILQLDGAGPIIALNTATGEVVGDQIAFYNTVVQGEGVVQATNQGSITNGVAFYGPATTAPNLNVQLTGSSLWVDLKLTPSFTVGPISGDATSTAVFNQTPNINTSSGTTGNFAGGISGTAGVTIIGNGQQIFGGSNSYAGPTNVLSGKLTLQNSNIPGTLLVANSGTLSGTGTVSGTAVINGTVRPGNSPGTLQFLSGLTLSPGSTTEIEINKTQASLLAVSGGNASISGTLKVLEDPGASVGKTLPIVTVTGGSVVGTFNKIKTTGPLIPIVLYSGSEVTLTLEDPPSSFAALLIAPDRLLRNIETLKHLDARRDGIPLYCTPSEEVESLWKRWFSKWTSESVCSNKPSEESQRPWSFYVEPTGSFGHVKTRKNVFGNSFQTVGARTGFDYLWADENAPDSSWCYGLGSLVEYNHWWGQQYHHAQTFSSNAAYGSIYGTFFPKSIRELSMNFIAGGGYSWYDFNRHPFESSLRTKGHPGGAQADALLDFEYVFHHERFSSFPEHFRLTSSAAVQYTYAHINGYQERGAGVYDLKIGHQTTTELSSLLGLRAGYLFLADSSVTICPELMVQWQHQYLNSSIYSNCSTSNTSEFPFTVPRFARNSLIAGADLRIDIHKKTTIQLNYDLWYNPDGIVNFFLLEFKTEF